MRFRTIDGKITERTPDEYPYSFTRFCVWNRGWRPGDRVVWSDRLSHQYNDFYRIKKDVLGIGDWLSRYEPEEIEKFMRILLEDDNLIVTGMEEECNYSTGYPYWLIYYRTKEATE